jgi:hypothetical protein
MRGRVVNLSIKAFNKQSSGLLAALHEAPFGRLIVKCLEIPDYAYSSRCDALRIIK